MMVDSMPTLHGPPSRISGTRSPSSSATCAAVVGLMRPKRLADGAAMPAMLALGTGEAAQQFERDRMAGHAQADGILPAGDGVGHPGLLLQDQRQRAGPEGFHQLPGDRWHLLGPVVDGIVAGQMDDQRVVGRAGPWRRKSWPPPPGWRHPPPGRRPSRSGWRPVRRRAAGRRRAGNPRRRASSVLDADGGAGGQGGLLHLFGVVADEREVAHLAPRSGVVLAVEVQLQVRDGVELGPVRLAVGVAFVPQVAQAGSTMTDAECARGSPSGRPHRARTCCSNWLVTQASRV